MDLTNAALLLVMGFLVGFSGAIMPGPLLVYTINESLRKGKWVGALVIVGHGIVEAAVFLVLALGLIELISTPSLIRAVGLAGGAALILMAAHSLKEINSTVSVKSGREKYGSVVGGMIFTAFNPGFPIWWMTAGSALLAEGFKEMGYAGMAIVFLGHWLADLGWFLFVSMTSSKGSRYLFERDWYRMIRAILSAMLLVIGLYFISSAVVWET